MNLAFDLIAGFAAGLVAFFGAEVVAFLAGFLVLLVDFSFLMDSLR